MFLLQVIIFPILLVTLLSVWNFQTVTVTAHAQSLLSDSEWLEENKDVFGKTGAYFAKYSVETF